MNVRLLAHDRERQPRCSTSLLSRPRITCHSHTRPAPGVEKNRRTPDDGPRTVDTTYFGLAEQTAIAWNRPRDLLAAPPPPDTPGGHFSSYLITVRPDGRPHTTGIGVRWYDGDIYFLSGPGTRKSRNLAANPACTIAMRLGRTRLVLEGEAAPVDDPAILDAVGALSVNRAGRSRLTAGGFTAPFGPRAAVRRGGSTASSSTRRSAKAALGRPAGASRANRSTPEPARGALAAWEHSVLDVAPDAWVRRQS